MTVGVAIDVPQSVLYAESLLDPVDVTPKSPLLWQPGALTSGFRRPSSVGPQLLKGAIALVLVSRSESFANVVMEAAAVGCPCVISPEVGLSTAVAEARAGIVAAPSDPPPRERDHPLRAEPDDGGSRSRLDNVEVGLKLASFALARHGVLLGGGIEAELPTGDAGKGIGSDEEVGEERQVLAPQVSHVGALHDDDAVIVAERVVELTVPYIDGIDARGAGLQQTVGEAAGRSADVSGDEAVDIKLERRERRLQLQAPTPDVAWLGTQ